MAPKRALIIGGTGQVGRASAAELLDAGWEVEVASRRPEPDPSLSAAGARCVQLDRTDTAALLAAASGRDLVLDVVAFTPEHAHQLTRLAGDVGSLVVISTGAVYAGRNGSSGELAEADDSPEYPVPIGEDWATLPGDGPDYGSRKAAMERVLLDAPGLPVSILRPGTLHGPYSTSLHHWSFIKRVLDGRKQVVLAFDGASRFATSAAANVARLVRLCAETPARRVLNAADDQALSVAEIGAKVFAAMGADIETVTFPGPPREGRLGFNPWGVPNPIVLSMDRARAELGYAEAISYDDALALDIEWAVDAVAAAEAAGKTWQDVFPGVVARYGEHGWFPYDVEDTYLAT